MKPLLAAPANLDTLRFPLLASPKMDGIRALTGIGPAIVSRNLKPIPNRFIQESLGDTSAWAMDGELLTYTDGRRDDFNTVQSKVMSEAGEPDFRFHAFDSFYSPNAPFHQRWQMNLIFLPRCLRVVPMIQEPCRTLADVLALEKAWVERDGWEGVMLRDPEGPYKFGRSTAKEQILLKLKRFEDDEATVTGSIERFTNTNALERDALGRAKRSNAKAGLVPSGTLGALSVTWRGIAFEIGTGFDDATRAALWRDRESLPGKRVTFRFQGVGTHGAPRFPVFAGFCTDKE